VSESKFQSTMDASTQCAKYRTNSPTHIPCILDNFIHHKMAEKKKKQETSLELN